MSNYVQIQKTVSLDNNYKLSIKSVYNSPVLKQVNLNLPTKMINGILRQSEFFIYVYFFLFFCKTPILTFRRIKQKDNKFIGTYYIKLLLSDEIEIFSIVNKVFLNSPGKSRIFLGSEGVVSTKECQILFQLPLSVFSATRIEQILNLGGEFYSSLSVNLSVVFRFPESRNTRIVGNISTLPYFWING